MTDQTQTIDISPEKVAPVAQTGLKLLSLGTTLVPGDLRAQIGVLEVLLAGLAGGHLVLAPAPEVEVESKAKTSKTGKKDGTGQKGPINRRGAKASNRRKKKV